MPRVSRVQKGQFAGHETFPLRLLWLKKVFDAVAGGAASNFFQSPEAIAYFGVGRNMVLSMRHWATSARIIEENDKRLQPTQLGTFILDSKEGFDPYLEKQGAIWLVHWEIASHLHPSTTIYYVFNQINTTEFTVEQLNDSLRELINENGWKVSDITLKRDIEVFFKSYARKHDGSSEDAAEPLLAELGLIRPVGNGHWYEFVRGAKPSLPDEIFSYAVLDFWNRTQPTASTLTVEQICYAPGSPGRVFKLDEDSVTTRLTNIHGPSLNTVTWSDTAGLRQIQRLEPLDPHLVLTPLLKTRTTS